LVKFARVFGGKVGSVCKNGRVEFSIFVFKTYVLSSYSGSISSILRVDRYFITGHVLKDRGLELVITVDTCIMALVDRTGLEGRVL